MLDGLKGEDSIAELCRCESIAQGFYDNWSKEVLEAGKKRRAGDTAPAAISTKMTDLRRDPAISWRVWPSRRWNCGCSKKQDRILKSCNLVTSPAYMGLSVADAFRDKTTRPKQLWQTDFTDLKVIALT